MEGLLWLIVQRIRSQSSRGWRHVWCNLMHTNRQWRMQPPVFHPPFSDCPTAPSAATVSWPTVTLWHVSSNCVIGQTTEEDLLSLQGLTQSWVLPHIKSECTDVDMMKWSVLHDLFVSIFLDFCCLCCFVVHLYLTFGAGIFFLILTHPVYKMWILHEPNMLELWNKLHFEEKKWRIYNMFKIFSTYICWINI